MHYLGPYYFKYGMLPFKEDMMRSNGYPNFFFKKCNGCDSISLKQTGVQLYTASPPDSLDGDNDSAPGEP